MEYNQHGRKVLTVHVYVPGASAASWLCQLHAHTAGLRQLENSTYCKLSLQA